MVEIVGGEVGLDDVVMEWGDGYDGKWWGKEVVEEVLVGVEMMKEKYGGDMGVGNCREDRGEREIKVGRYIGDGE